MMFGERFIFRNRADAATKLALLLNVMRLDDPFVLGIPRGGAPIGRTIADALLAPFSVYVSRKIGAPGNPEFGIGAVTEEGTYLLDSASIQWLDAKPDVIETTLQEERQRCDEYVRKFREANPLPSIEGKTVILCDDGLATGLTMLAAVKALSKRKQKGIVVASPVASAQAAAALRDEGAAVVACSIPNEFRAVAQFYECFDQLTDEDVIQSLKRPVLYNS